MLEPDEMIGANTSESAETETLLAVLYTRLDSTTQADPEPSVGPSTPSQRQKQHLQHVQMLPQARC